MPPERKPNWFLFVTAVSLAISLPFGIRDLNLMIEIAPRSENIPPDVWATAIERSRFLLALKGFAAIAVFYAFTGSAKTEKERRYGLTDGIAMSGLTLLWLAVYAVVHPKNICLGVWLILLAVLVGTALYEFWKYRQHKETLT